MAAIACDYIRRVDEYVLVARIDAPSSAIRNQPCCDLLGRHLCKALGMRKAEGQRYLFTVGQCNMLPEKHPAGPPTYMPPEIHTASAALPLARNGCGCALRRQTETSRGCGILGPKSYLDEQSVHVSIETAVAEQSSLMALREVEVILACTCLHL